MEPVSPSVPIVRQCELLDLSRSSFYYEPEGESELNLLLMRLIDEEFMRHPFCGVPRMKAWLWTQGYEVNRKRVSRLMRLMGLAAIYPKPRLSWNGSDHKVNPYLLNGLTINAPDQAWCTDITYIRLAHGFVYLVAVMDWNSRYVLSWELSTTLDKGFCLDADRQALQISKPKIFNTDQGSQFTSTDFTRLLEKYDIKVSMDGRGRVYDNIFIERLWRSAKCEEMFLHEYQTVAEAKKRLGEYFRFYNEERLHEVLDYRTPSAVYFGTSTSMMPTAVVMA